MNLLFLCITESPLAFEATLKGLETVKNIRRQEEDDSMWSLAREIQSQERFSRVSALRGTAHLSPWG